jgi:hypothetical protein
LFPQTRDETILKPFSGRHENRRKRRSAIVQTASAEVDFLEVAMTALVQALYRVSHTETETDILKMVSLFCGAGLFVSLLLATYGLDLSAGFF